NLFPKRTKQTKSSQEGTRVPSLRQGDRCEWASSRRPNGETTYPFPATLPLATMTVAVRRRAIGVLSWRAAPLYAARYGPRGPRESEGRDDLPHEADEVPGARRQPEREYRGAVAGARPPARSLGLLGRRALH